MWDCRCGAGVPDGQGVVVGDGLQLQRMLLRVICGQNLIEDDESAVAIAS